ncbi:MAG: LLM class flavin-dependent oxidoreductase [Actinomycetota bacterium]
MQLGTSVRFLFPGSERTDEFYAAMQANLPPGAFTERPLGPLGPANQAAQLEAIAGAAAEARLWGMLVGDNHAIPAVYANCFQPVPSIARLSTMTADLLIGAVVLAPFYNPLLLAEQIGTLAAFTDAPQMWVFAVGGNGRTFERTGIPMNERGRRTSRIMEVVGRLLAGETVTASGPGWELDEASIAPLPAVRPYLFVGGAADAVLRRGARLGDGWLTAQNSTDDELATQLDYYRQQCAVHDKTPFPVLRRDILVTETDQEALDIVQPILDVGYRGVTIERLLVGSPDTILERLAGYDAAGFNHVMVRHVTGNTDTIVRSIQLLGEHVIPTINSWPEHDLPVRPTQETR